MSVQKAAVTGVMDRDHHKRTIDQVLRYELYRHRDISERLSDLLGIGDNGAALNRSTWDILFFLLQSHLLDRNPTVTDIYIATNLSKGTAITGLAELEKRGAVRKARDGIDGRRRRLCISEKVAALLEAFVVESGERLGDPIQAMEQAGVTMPSADNAGGPPTIDLLRQLSHELRTPLTAIVGFSEMIADESLGPVHPAGYAEYARDIRRAASHLLTSLNDLVDSTLANQGASIPLGALTNVDIEELIDNACRGTAALAARRNITLRRKWGTAKDRVLGDKARLEQAIQKLVTSSVIAAGHNQIVDIETELQEDSVFVRIISPEPPSPPQRKMDAAAIGALEKDDFVRTLPLIRAIASAHGGAFASRQEGPRRYVTALSLPIKGPVAT